jgi:hypothetical protein
MTGFATRYPQLFSSEPFDDGWYARAANDLPEVQRLNQRARMNEFRTDLKARVRARIHQQRANRSQ